MTRIGRELLALLAAVISLSCASPERAGPRSVPPADAGTSSALQPGTVRCGATKCTSHGFGKIEFGPCCPAAAPGRCGVDVSPGAVVAGLSAGCMQLDAPGQVDVSCPALPVASGAGFPGCRKPSGKCGVVLSLGNVGLGCVETGSFAAQSTGTPSSAAASTSSVPIGSGSPSTAPTPRKPDQPGAISHRCCDALAMSGGGTDPMVRKALLQAAGDCIDLADRGVAKKRALAKLRAVLKGGGLPRECR